MAPGRKVLHYALSLGVRVAILNSLGSSLRGNADAKPSGGPVGKVEHRGAPPVDQSNTGDDLDREEFPALEQQAIDARAALRNDPRGGSLSGHGSSHRVPAARTIGG